MVSIPISRDDGRTAFESRQAFVERWGQGPKPIGFCKLLEGAAAGVHDSRKKNHGNVWKGFPWLTMVLGSGCLELTDDPALDPLSLSVEIDRVITDLVDTETSERKRCFGRDVIGQSVSEADHAKDFAASLIRDRLQVPRTSRSDVGHEPSPTAGVVVSQLAARFVLLASQLTRLYYEAMAREERPLSRWEADSACLSTTATDSKSRDERDLSPVIELCQWHCAQSLAEIDHVRQPGGLSEDMKPAVVDLLTRVQRGVGEPTEVKRETIVELKVLRQITEVAWYLMTLGRAAYPGWTELLFGLLLQAHGGSGLSLLRSKYQSDPIRDLLLPATEQSWSDRCKSIASPRAEFYDAVASVLSEQSRVIRDSGITSHPPAVAFVTSFDVEVEMAMWARAEDGESFFVVVPVHVFSDRDDTVARPCWLRGEIRRTANPHPSIKELCDPVSWHVLSDAAGDGLAPLDLHEAPHIVHLSGAPLIDLPSAVDVGLWAELHHVGVLGPKAPNAETRVMIEHAVTTDEYLAVRQAEAELLLTAEHEKDQKNRRSRGLPAHLTSSNPRGEVGVGQNPRFWFLAGVPVGDPAIRHRLISQLSPRRPQYLPIGAPGLDDPDLAEVGLDGGPTAEAGDADEDLMIMGLAGQEQATEPPLVEAAGRAPLGIVINRRISDEQSNLLYWMGFDVIRESASSFTGDLHHYRGHLCADGWRAWPKAELGCELAERGCD